MNSNNTMSSFQVKPLVNSTLKFPSVWDRNFDHAISTLGKKTSTFIPFRKALREVTGKCYSYVMACIELSRRFNSPSFYHSNEKFLDYSQPGFSDATLKRRKVQGAAWVTVSHSGNNTTTYHLNKVWFENFINALFIKLGIQQGQNELSHIISIDTTPNPSTISQCHNHFEKFENDNCKQKAAAEYETMLNQRQVVPSKAGTQVVRGVAVKKSLSALMPKLNPEQQALVGTLLRYKIFPVFVADWITRFPVGEIYDKIEQAKIRGIPSHKFGSYVRVAMQNVGAYVDFKAPPEPRVALSSNVPEFIQGASVVKSLTYASRESRRALFRSMRG